MLTTEPSAGYWNDCTSAVVDVGHSRSPSDHGVLAWDRDAEEERARARRRRCAAAELQRQASPMRRAAATTATARRITANQGSAAFCGAFSRRAVPRRRRGGRRRAVCSVVSGSSVTIRAPISTPTIDDDADDDRRPHAEVAVAALIPGADDDRRQDREQRRALRLELSEPEHDERRARRGCPPPTPNIPASTPAARPRTIARRDGRRAHVASSQTPIAVSSTAKP